MLKMAQKSFWLFIYFFVWRKPSDIGLTIFQHHLVSPPPSVAGLSVSGSLREIAPSPSPWRILYRINSYCSNASICKMFKDKWTYCLWKIGLSLFLYTASNTHPLNTPRIRFITKNAPRTTMETKYMNCHVQPCESWIWNIKCAPVEISKEENEWIFWCIDNSV